MPGKSGGSLPADPPRRGRKTSATEGSQRLELFLARLARMSEEERVLAARYRFVPWERLVWAGHYPDEVPLVDGEYEWIAFALADLD